MIQVPRWWIEFVVHRKIWASVILDTIEREEDFTHLWESDADVKLSFDILDTATQLTNWYHAWRNNFLTMVVLYNWL